MVGCLLACTWLLLIPRGLVATPTTPAHPLRGSNGGWVKYPQNPVLGGHLGTCFDICVLRSGRLYDMWYSWRPKKSIALVTSHDGIHWGKPIVVLGPDRKTGWQDDVNRPVVVYRHKLFRMWYTGQTRTHSRIGYATSHDGIHWNRRARPVLSPTRPWERMAVMCPDVIWDRTAREYKMWYSGGDQYEPKAIGLAVSKNGINWKRFSNKPIFTADKNHPWEQDRVTACQVIQQGPWYYMFYIGFENVHRAAIGLARSRNGVDHWQRLPANPILFPGEGTWDADACYKPFAIYDGKQWRLWYNGRRGTLEQIGVAFHKGRHLGFGR
ncbi:MAG: hypothetical protein HKL96_04455 [Phycisphaerales bacterium]|nr:hypothetical protein [Phycisphaerales bacterium]